MHSFCSGGEVLASVVAEKKIPGASRVLRICSSAKIVASLNRGSWPKLDNVKIGKAKPQKCILKVFCWTHWNFKIFTRATVLLTSKLANLPQNFCQQEPFVKTNVSSLSLQNFHCALSVRWSHKQKFRSSIYFYTKKWLLRALWSVVAHDLLEYR